MKNEEVKNGNIIECVYRRYSVQLPGGMVIEVESAKPLSGQMTHILLEEDDIGSFFENYKIIAISKVEDRPDERVQKVGRLRKSRERSIGPLERLNSLLLMPGDFTRIDYQEYMQTKCKVKMSTFMGHSDIEAALALNKLEALGKTKDSRFHQYRVIDQTQINKDQYITLSKDQRK